MKNIVNILFVIVEDVKESHRFVPFPHGSQECSFDSRGIQVEYNNNCFPNLFLKFYIFKQYYVFLLTTVSYSI